MNAVLIEDLGLIDYKACWDYQEGINQKIVAVKSELRKHPESGIEIPAHRLLFCEHPLVFTLGKSGNESNLLLNDAELEEGNFSYYKINRGGDITHHGPGQLVMYPIFDLEQFFTDIHKFLRFLEEAVILTLAEFGIIAGRFPSYTGVWIDAEHPTKARKICAMGIRCSRWVTMHGIALNVNNDLSPFDHIIPCGIDDKSVTSMARELGEDVPIELVKSRLSHQMEHIFQFKAIEGGK
ncbi:MAG: lipoyl(octanoyl) transferase LipB [Flavobacteriales bacterium]|nr:lipoyl(octanoyl) transferase LipB [Flavobacteriales bacterium]